VFSGIEEIITPVEKDNVKAVYHIYVIQLRTEMLKVGRKEIFEALRAENIGVNVHYMPLHLHPFYQREFGYKEGDYPRAERYYERAITLPIFPRMSDNDVEDVIKAVIKVLTYYRR
jgi:dTDP-4-amino-4,6-dideoxygalactose transaminase